MLRLRSNTRWFVIGIGVKRWLFLMAVGFMAIAIGLAIMITLLFGTQAFTVADVPLILTAIALGVLCIAIAGYRLSVTILGPYRRNQPGHLVDVVYGHSRRQKGFRFVAIGGGTGLPSALRAIKPYTNNITAIVTVADDGGSSGRLRRDMGVLPPGDLRNNIAALADDESLLAQLFQYRFSEGDLRGHSFGNLFIAALSGVAGGLENALIETERVLNIQGRVLPSTLDDVRLQALVRQPGKSTAVTIIGESKIGESKGHIERLTLIPEDAQGYDESVQAILNADTIVIGPGSLFTSILPNLLVQGIKEALRATPAYKIYICNVATQPGETSGYSVADHVMALERHIGRGVFQAVLANDAYPSQNAGINTHYVQPVPPHHEVMQRYEIHYYDLTDGDRPWRHDPIKLAEAILSIREKERIGSKQPALS